MRVAGVLMATLKGANVLDPANNVSKRTRRPVEISVAVGTSVVGCRNIIGAAPARSRGEDGRTVKDLGTGNGETGKKRGAEEVK